MVLLIGRTYLSGFCGLFLRCAEAEERVKTGNYKDKKISRKVSNWKIIRSIS